MSIIVPVYNGELFISRCIESIKNQTFQDWELILIDDGSIDNTWELCQQYAENDSRIVVYRQKNSGQGAARNFALTQRKGKYIMFIDADDLLLDHKTIEGAIDYLDNNAEVDVVQFPYVRFTDSEIRVHPQKHNVIFSTKKEFIESTDILNSVSKTRFILKTSPWGKVFRSELFSNVQFPEDMVYEDTFMFCDLLKVINRIALIDKGLYGNYERMDSTTHSAPSVSRMEDKVKAFCRIMECLQEYSDNKAIKRSFTLWLLKLIASFKGMYGHKFNVDHELSVMADLINYSKDKQLLLMHKIGIKRLVTLLSCYYRVKWTFQTPA